jgi:hypothetical protein
MTGDSSMGLRARDLLKDVTRQGIGIRRLQLVFAPSFEPGFAWDIRLLGSVWRLFRSEVSDEDYSELMRLTGYEELDAEDDMLRGYVDRLRALTLPIGPMLNDLGGLDGTSYHLALFGDLHSEVRFQWWSDSPPQWAPLVEIANEMIEAFLRLRPKDA